MKDGDFDRLRIPMETGSAGPDVREADAETDGVNEAVEEAQRLGVAATPTRLAVGSAIIAGLILAGLAAVRRWRRSGARSSSDGAA